MAQQYKITTASDFPLYDFRAFISESSNMLKVNLFSDADIDLRI